VALICTSITNCYTNCYLKYQLVLDIPITFLSASFEIAFCRLVFQVALIGTSNTNWYTNCYLKYQLVLDIPIAFLSASISDTTLQIGILDTK
jgi:hypothetical protein